MLFSLTGCASSLMNAAESGDITQMRTLLDAGANVNEEYPIAGGTALYLAVAYNAPPEAVKLLIDRGADVNKGMRNGWRPIHLAIDNGNATLTRLLLDGGAVINTNSPRGTPREIAQQKGLSSIISMLDEADSREYRKLAGGSAPANRTSGSGIDSASNTSGIKHAELAMPARADIDTNIPTGKPAGKYDVAVVIGNQSYSASGTPNVDYALNDARIVREYLTKTMGYDPANIIYLENATLTKLYEVFGTRDDHRGKLFKWVKPGQSRVFIYYVGHGAPDQESGEAYFVPVDANPQYIRTGGYKLSTFYENISKIPAAKKIVVIDACFSGSSPNGQLLKGVSGLVARMKSEPKAGSAADMLFTSAGMDQVASWYPEKGHSLFTYFFLKGLQGEADANKDGRITMAEMKSYLNDQVPYMARRLTGNEQQPQFIGIESDEVSSYTK
jgi:hypothetical protein